MYKLLRSLLFLFDPEWVHYFSMNGLKLICKAGALKKLVASKFNARGNFQSSIFNFQIGLALEPALIRTQNI